MNERSTHINLHKSSGKITDVYLLICMFPDSRRKSDISKINGSKQSLNSDAFDQTKFHWFVNMFKSELNFYTLETLDTSSSLELREVNIPKTSLKLSA
jgi:hypothetical protein